MADSTRVSMLRDESFGKKRSFWGDALARIRRDKLTLFAVIILFLLTLASFGGPPLVEYVLQVDVEEAYASRQSSFINYRSAAFTL